jgi:hypothetical protein
LHKQHIILQFKDYTSKHDSTTLDRILNHQNLINSSQTKLVCGHLSVCVCVCVFFFLGGRQTEKERETHTHTHKEGSHSILTNILMYMYKTQETSSVQCKTLSVSFILQKIWGGRQELILLTAKLKNTRGPIFKKNHVQYYILFRNQLVVKYINATSLELPHTHHKKERAFPT